MDVLVAVDVPLIGDARLKNWAKVVNNVDETKANGWAFDGDFIAAGGVQDVPVGAVVMVYGERGSRVNPQIEARVMVANGDGTLTHIQSASGRAWARTLRDKTAELLLDRIDTVTTGLAWDEFLMQYSDEAILDEMGRRGLGPE